MSLQHAQLKANALLSLEKFVTALTNDKKNKILTNQRIDMSAMLKINEYVELNKAIADLNKFIAVNSSLEKEDKRYKS